MRAFGPPRPADMDEASMRELAVSYLDHVGVLVAARFGAGDACPAEEVRGSALSVLALSAAMAQRLEESRWVTVGDALAAGASLDDLASAMSMQPGEVAAGFRSWVDTQVFRTFMTPPQRDEVLELLGDAYPPLWICDGEDD